MKNFVGILVEGSMDGKHWCEIEVIPEMSGDITIEDCPIDLSHITESIKDKYGIIYARAIYREYGHLWKNQITGKFESSNS